MKELLKKLSFTHLLALVMIVILVVVLFMLFDRKQGKSDQTADQSPANFTMAVDDNTNARLKGCDISHWDGEIQWSGLKKSGIKFLFIKATQGTEYIDPRFESNWENARLYNFNRGAYHFYMPREDPVAQAKHFLQTVGHEKGDILPVLDIEISHGIGPDQLSKDIALWIDTVKDSIGRYPIIYTDLYFWTRHIQGDFKHCPLWVAQWENTNAPNLENTWNDWVFWQYADNGTVAGIPSANGKVDLDYFHGDEMRLRNYKIK